MAPLSAHSAASAAWALAAKQHGVIALFQLVALGYTLEAVRWRVANGRLHPVYRGVYAVGRPNLTRKGEWMAAVLACAPTAALSHETGAALWGLRQETPRGVIHISVPAGLSHHHRGIAVHRRSALTWPRSRRGDARIEQTDITLRDGIPVTAPILTLIDLAARLPERRLEAAINEADRLDLVTPMELREELEARRGQRGVGAIKAVLDCGGFVLTESDLERRFLPVAARAGLPTP